ncbi:MAG: type 4a pilus biogenesis protein PilO [Phycisphaerae bacterium]|nr:type 4a pilus biogenesis protein PilO [Phycisphaerae bacterium]
MNINRREMIFIGLTLAILLAAWLFILKPREDGMDQMQAQIQEKQRLLEEIETSRPRAIGNLQKDIENLKDVVSGQQARLPQDEKIEKVFEDLSNLAAVNQLRIHQIRTNQTPSNPASEQEHPGIEEQGFLLELEGEFQGVQAFLETLEKQSRILRLDEIRLLRDSKKSEDSTVQANFRLRFFSRKGTKAS